MEVVVVGFGEGDERRLAMIEEWDEELRKSVWFFREEMKAMAVAEAEG